MSNIMITVAPTGAESSTSMNPNVPVTPEQIVDTAVACEAAGAAMIHVHVRDEQERSSLDLALLGDVMAGVRENTDLIVQLSTGGGIEDSFQDRMRVLELTPDSCSLTLGTVNFGNGVFQNPWPFIVELYKETKSAGVLPEFEIFDLGQIATLRRLLDDYGTPFNNVVHCDLVLGVPGGAPGTAATVIDLARALPPETTSWSATGVGRTTLPVALAAVASGGHLRVGMEDVLKLSPGVLVESNAQLVTRANELVTFSQQTVATPAQARELLSLAAGLNATPSYPSMSEERSVRLSSADPHSVVQQGHQ